MPLLFEKIKDERSKSPRSDVNNIETLFVRGIFGDPVTDINSRISDKTQERALEILWNMSQEFEKSGLTLDAFQVPYDTEKPAKKLFIAGELINDNSSTERYGDIVMSNGMRTFGDSYLDGLSEIQFELPLGDYTDSTRETMKFIWDKISKISGGNKGVIHTRRMNSNSEVIGEGIQVLQDIGYHEAKEKPTYDDMMEVGLF